MPHMMAAERMGYLDANALANSPARNQATITAALAALGSTVAWLVLPFSGDGVWTITSNTSIARLYVPFGVTVDVAVGVTLGVGLVDAANSAWKTGPGTLNITASSTPMQLSHLSCTSYFQSNSSTGIVWTLNAGAGNPAAINMYTDQGGSSTGIGISRNIANTNSTWQLLANTPGDFIITRPGGSPQVLVNNTGMMLGANASPSYLLHLNTDSAGKPGASGLWTPVSDEETKELVEEFKLGMPQLRLMPTAWYFRYNGKAGTPTDGTLDVGYKAQELVPIFPALVRELAGTIETASGETRPLLGTNLGQLIYVHTNALKELDTRLLALESLAPQALPPPEEQEESDAEEKTEAKTEDAPKRPRRRAS